MPEANTATAPDDIAQRINADKEEIVNAFRAKHGCEPEDCAIEIIRLPGNRVLWHVRKMGAKEREVRDTNVRRRELDAISKSNEKVFMYGVELEDKDRLSWGAVFAALFYRTRRQTVFLTERGANAQCGSAERVVKLEVLA